MNLSEYNFGNSSRRYESFRNRSVAPVRSLQETASLLDISPSAKTSVRGGIPWPEILRRLEEGNIDDEIKGNSGLALRYRISRFELSGVPYQQIFIEDAENIKFHLGATVDLSSMGLKYQLRTRGFQSDPQQRHPDMYARKFIGDALRIYQERWGIIPTHFTGEWEYGLSDNLETFYNNFKKTHDPVEAAKKTWTGIVMMEDHGFTDITTADIKIEPYKILGKSMDPTIVRPDKVEAIFWRKR